MDFASGQGPSSIVIGDLDEDGRPDLALADPPTNGTSILLGRGDGRFPARGQFLAGTGDQFMSLATGDVNGDGRPDLVVGNAGSAYPIAVLLGIGDCTFSGATFPELGRSVQGLAIGDLNQDGHPDLVAATLEPIPPTLASSATAPASHAA